VTAPPKVLNPGETVVFGDDGTETINPKPPEDLQQVQGTQGG
jgi:hypothetical protein